MLETRNSNGLDQFCTALQERTGMTILDLGGVNQGTVDFIGNYGHRMEFDDFLLQLDECFGRENFYENQTNPRAIDNFLKTALAFPDESFDGALVWDVLEYLAPPLLTVVVQRLRAMLRPGASLLAIFHAEERAESVRSYSFRIHGHRTIQLTERGWRQPAQYFNNRNLEKLFQGFESVKFFLTRDNLREVIVRR